MLRGLNGKFKRKARFAVLIPVNNLLFSEVESHSAWVIRFRLKALEAFESAMLSRSSSIQIEHGTLLEVIHGLDRKLRNSKQPFTCYSAKEVAKLPGKVCSNVTLV